MKVGTSRLFRVDFLVGGAVISQSHALRSRPKGARSLAGISRVPVKEYSTVVITRESPSKPPGARRRFPDLSAQQIPPLHLSHKNKIGWHESLIPSFYRFETSQEIPFATIKMFSYLTSIALAVLLHPQLAEARLEAPKTHISGRGSSQTRELFVLPDPFEFYDDACKASCGDSDDEEMDPFYNACPKCPEKYSACNSCCFDGASSLKVRWHGCPGTLTLTTPDQAHEDCEVETPESQDTTVRFVDCACFDEITIPGSSSMGCGLFDSIRLAMLTSSTFFDFCLVSVHNLAGAGFVIDLSKALPAIIGIQFVGFEEVEPTDPSWNPYPLVTYFDTTCELLQDPQVPHAHPLFPGYGKFPNTCPGKGFIDLETGDTALLPDTIDHSDGYPPTNAFWFEFIDGTSTGFWSKTPQDSYFFQPTFATCACTECDSEDEATGSPTLAPTPGLPATEAPSSSPSNAPTTPASAMPTTVSPSKAPSSFPTEGPTLAPARGPTGSSSDSPSVQPTREATLSPTGPSGGNPGPRVDTVSPTSGPTEGPTPTPSQGPSLLPTEKPTPGPTGSPPVIPSNASSLEPTLAPTSPFGMNPVPPGETLSPTLISTTAPVCVPGSHDTEPPTPSGGNQGPPGPGSEECEVGDFSDCNSFAIFNCRTSGLGNIPDGALCVYQGPQNTGNRNLQVLKAAISNAKNVKKADGSSTLQNLIESGEFVEQDIIDAMKRNLERLFRLEIMVHATI
jgi:hypothetical protein